MVKRFLSLLKNNLLPAPPSRAEPPGVSSADTGGWEIKHTLSGRIRLRNRQLYRNITFCRIVENRLTHTPGILSCTVSQITCSAVITYNETRIDTVRILHIFHVTEEGPERAGPKDGGTLAMGAASLGIAAMAEFALPALMPVGALLLAYTCLPDLEKGLRSVLKKRRLSAQLLGPIVLASCILTGEILVGSFMVFSLALGRKLLETVYDNSRNLLVWSFEKRIRSLKILRDGTEIQIPPDKIAREDVLVLQTGDMIPVDGIIQRGFGLIDQYHLIGESQPIAGGVGDRVYHPGILLSGSITMMAEKVGPDTLSHRIGGHLQAAMDDCLKRRDRSEALADKAVPPTLALGSIAAMTVGIGGGIAVANCNFGIGPLVSAPLGGLAALSLCMESGILVKDIRKLEALSAVDTLIFDKSSLLDHRRLAVHRIIPCDDCDGGRIARICAAALEQFSNPIATAIQEKCRTLNLDVPQTNTVRYHVGRGITAQLEERTVHVGSAEFMEKQGIPVPESVSKEMARCHQRGYRLVMVARDQCLMGAVIFCPLPHRGMRRVLTELRHRGIKHFAVLSGDTGKATAALADDLGIERYFCNVPSEETPHYIHLLRNEGHRVCFVSAGNHARAAFRDAHVSISVDGLEGIDNNGAPIGLLKEDLTGLPVLLDISHDLERKIKRSRDYTLLSNGLCIAGVFLLGFGIWHSVVFTSATMIAALMNNMPSIHGIAENKVDKALEMEMFLPVQETGLMAPLATKPSRSATQAAPSSVSS